MDYQALTPVVGTVESIRPLTGACCSQMLALTTESGQVNFVISSQTLIINHTQLRPGMRIAACYDRNLPVPLIYPPQYQAQFIAVLRPGEQAYLGFFGRNLTAADQALRLNIAPSTAIVTVNGQRFLCSPANRFLFVYYSVTTRSIPPQTTPRKIVVLC